MIAEDIRRFLEQFENTLKELAVEGQAVELDARLRDYKELLKVWLDVAPGRLPLPKRFPLFETVDRFNGPLEIDFHEVAKKATKSGDPDSVVELSERLFDFAMLCQRKRQPELMGHFLSTIVFFAYQCIETSHLWESLGPRIDANIYYLFSESRAEDVLEDEADLLISEERGPFLDTTRRFILDMINAAIRNNKAKDAGHFVGRLFEHRRHQAHRGRYSIKPPVANGYEAGLDYMAVVLVGWSLHVLNRKPEGGIEAAEAVLQKAAAQLPSMPFLISLWETFRGTNWPNSEIDHRLGVSRWDIRDWGHEYRVGISDVRSGRDDWLLNGLRAALWMTGTRFIGDVKDLFPAPADRFVWNVTQEKVELENLAKNRWLNIPEREREPRLEEILKVLGERAHGGDAEYLRYVLENPLSEKRVAQFKKEAIAGYQSKGYWMDALLMNATLAGQGEGVIRLNSATRRMFVPREFFLDDNNWATSFGGRLGEGAAATEAVELLGNLEREASRIGEMDELRQLPHIVREARSAVASNDCEPDILVLPREHRFAGALFSKPLWSIEGRSDFGGAGIGRWEGMIVLKYPYYDAGSIMLIDSRKALARHIGHSSVDINIDESPVDPGAIQRREMAIQALQPDGGALPDSQTIQVLVEMVVEPQSSIVDLHGVARIEIGPNGGKLVLPGGDNFYHRPSCEQIAGEVQHVMRIGRDSQRQPCPDCLPDQWNDEGYDGFLDPERKGDS
jgi:hypothetical protein